MVNSIGNADAAALPYKATPAPAQEAGAGPTDSAATTGIDTAATGAQKTAPAPAQSTESADAARLGEQLTTQADASRVQRAVAASTAASGTGAGTASSETTDTDYIAEADTNSDKTVSDQERAAYEARLREQAEVRAAYGQDERSSPALDVTA